MLQPSIHLRNSYLASLKAMLACTTLLYSGASFAESPPAQTYRHANGSTSSELDEARSSWRNDREFNGNWGLAAINADAAYAQGYTGLNSVIGIIDQPVWSRHPEFVKAVSGLPKATFITTSGTYVYQDPYITDRVPGAAFTYDGRIYVDGTGDVSTHGVHVAGIAAANRDTTAGSSGVMQGVAFNALIVAADNGDPGPEDGIVAGNDGNAYRAAFQAMIDNNVDIITNSWGIGITGSSWTYTDAAAQFSEIEAILGTPAGGAYDGAIAAAERGIVVEFSAGNDSGREPDALAGLAAFIPSLESHWIDTISVQRNLNRSGFSTICGYTKYFCVAAPGSGINSSIVDANITGLTRGDIIENPTNKYASFSGTSMAGPFVTGAFGVLRERYSYLSNADINSILKTTAFDLGAPGVDEIYGWGLINLDKALRGPGQLIGHMRVALPADTQDRWSNDINQEALNQRKREEQVEVRDWQASNTSGNLSPLVSQELVANTTSAVQLLRDLIVAINQNSIESPDTTQALNALISNPLGQSFFELYWEHTELDTERSDIFSLDRYEDFIAANSVAAIASRLANADPASIVENDLTIDGATAVQQRRIEMLRNKTDADYIGSLAKSGDGTLSLDGKNSYQGLTHVQGGTLIINGSVTGATQVDASGIGQSVTNARTGEVEVSTLGGHLIVNGTTGDVLAVAGGRATLNGMSKTVTAGFGGLVDGSGRIGALVAQSGSIIAPGNSIGTLTVTKAQGDGSVLFESGSTYAVEIAADGRSDLLVAEGQATLNGGLVSYSTIAPEQRFDVVKNAADNDVKYRILTADGGVSGQFEQAAETGYALYRSRLVYDANTVLLGFDQERFDTLGETYNERETLNTIENTGTGEVLYDELLATKDGQNLKPILTALSGEIYASTKADLLSSAAHVRSAAFERLRNSMAISEDPNTISSYLWGQGFGTWGKVDGDGNASTYRSNVNGVFAGFDGAPNDAWLAGVLFGYSHSNVKTDYAKNDVDSFHVGLYGGTQWNGLALRLAAGYSHHELSADRQILDRATLSADYRAEAFQASAELAYEAIIGDAKVEPFANVAFNYLSSDRFNEKGDPIYALSGESNSDNLLVTGLGLRASQEITVDGLTNLRLNGSASWRHAQGDLTPASKLSFVGGNSFENLGAPIARNAAALSAGIGLDLSATASLTVDYVGEFSSNTKNHGVKALVNVKF